MTLLISFSIRARRLRKALGGGMRQVGILAAAGLVALDIVVPKLGEDHARILQIAKAIDNLKSPNVKVDMANVQTNILLIQMINVKFTADNFRARLCEVKEAEISAQIKDKNGKGIAMLVSSRDWAYARIVIYTNITDEDVDLAIKKITYVVKEIDQNLM